MNYARYQLQQHHIHVDDIGKLTILKDDFIANNELYGYHENIIITN